MMPIRCDNIVEDNLTNLTSKNSSNPILIKKKKLQLKTYKIIKMLKTMSLVL
jgi:hypothetical protein